MKITKKLVRECFDYDPLAPSCLRWKVNNKSKKVKGLPVGCLWNGYFKCKWRNKPFIVHRIIFLYHHGWLPKTIDHIDGNSKNNKIENLRPATIQQNKANSKKQKTKSRRASKFKGVSWCLIRNRWHARIMFNGKRMHLGHYINEEEAGEAYDLAAKKFFKEYARTNDAIKQSSSV